MASSTSATGGRFVPHRRTSLLVALLLVTHLAMLVELSSSRPVGDGGPAHGQSVIHASLNLPGDVNGPALFALCTGLMLAFLLFARGRAQQPSADRKMQPFGAPATGSAPPARSPDDVPVDVHASLMARLHHDLRTPLNAMMGFADMMQAETFGPLGNERYRSYAAHMQSCGQELLRATESTLVIAELLSNPVRGAVLPIDLDVAIDCARAASIAEPAHDACRFKVVGPCNLRVRAEDAVLRHSLTHLFATARGRSGPGGLIEIHVQRCHGRVQMWISTSVDAAAGPRATTSCRPRTSAASSVDELPIGLARRLLGLQGIPLTVVTDTSSTWTVTLSLEDAAQSDFFDMPPQLRVPATA